MNAKDIIALLARYIILLLLAINNLFIIYQLFAPLTIYPVFFIINLLYSPASLLGNAISFSNSSIILVNACIAGAAYYFLIFLNISTPMPLKTRIKSLAFFILSFLFLNILRIVIFSVLFNAGFTYFNFAHKLTWHLGSTLLLIMLWLINIRLFSIKNIPIYTDIKSIIKLIKTNK